MKKPAKPRRASKAELRQEIAELRHVGAMMSNVCFNLSQQSGRTLADHDAESMAMLYRNWDAIKRREKS